MCNHGMFDNKLFKLLNLLPFVGAKELPASRKEDGELINWELVDMIVEESFEAWKGEGATIPQEDRGRKSVARQKAYT